MSTNVCQCNKIKKCFDWAVGIVWTNSRKSGAGGWLMGFHSTSSSNCAVELVSHSAFSARCIQKLCYLRQLLQCFNCVRKLDKGTADPLVLYCTYTRTQELQITSDSLTLFLIYIKGYIPVQFVLVCGILILLLQCLGMCSTLLTLWPADL